MINNDINQALINGKPLLPGVLPHLEQLQASHFVFEQDFGLTELPIQPGVISIRGPRQYGKSTWLEQQLALTIQQFGNGSALYLNGDEIIDHQSLTALLS